ncbi:hypothetical protein B296_00015133 [Ensete ventricosum]|uniref:Uncharacterized protein n=1 Tax=Ensete ventricosum TaxID=4639 RepID=A0A427B496_ENSVE|nr:hypothetical protein B296_00015133 [Ensete ventricosum]
MGRCPSWARGSSHDPSTRAFGGLSPFEGDLEALNEDSAIIEILQRGDMPTPFQRALGGSRRTRSISANEGLPLVAMELTSAPAPMLPMGAEVP